MTYRTVALALGLSAAAALPFAALYFSLQASA